MRLKPFIMIGCIVGGILLVFLWMSSHSRYVYVDASCEHFVEDELAFCEEAEADIWVDFLQVTLCSNPTTGFEWKLTDVSGQLRVEFMNKEYVPDTVNGIEGAGGTEVWTFRVGMMGDATISMEYSQPWEGGTKAAQTFDLALNVR